MAMDVFTVAESAVELRRVARNLLDPVARRRVEQVEVRLADELGPTMSKTRAARLLGVSVTALDTWIGRGAIPTVRKPGLKKAEVETQAFLELAAEVAAVRERGRRHGAVAQAVRRLEERRRSTASILDAAALIEDVSTIASAR